MSPRPLQVLVIGGGIGGLCLAQGLHHAGLDVSVFERERSRNDRLEGYRIHIDPDGAKAMHGCLPPAVWEAFVASTVDLGGFRFLSENLDELMVLESDPEGGGPTERSHAIDRVTLRELLLTGLDDVVHFDRKFERYEIGGDGRVTAHFADGSTATGDVLIGSDGVNSPVRKQYLPHAQHADTDAYGVGLKLPLTDEVRSWLTQPLASGRNMIMAPVPYFLSISVFDRVSTKDDSYVGSAFVGTRDVFPADAGELGGTELKELILGLIADWHPQLRRLLAESDPESALLVPYRTSVEPEPWESTNVTLMGDAVHAMPPVGGLGGNTSLRDADLLRRKLIAAASGQTAVLEAVADYEREMREYGFAAVRKALYYQQQGLRTDQTILKAMGEAQEGSAPPEGFMMEVRDLKAKDGYDLWAETYENDPNPVVDMDKRHTMGILAPQAGELILDAGCGTGRNLGAIIAAGARPSGLDYSTGMLAIARERHPDLTLEEGDLQKPFPFAGQSFDAVLFSLVAEHLDDPLAAFGEMHRVLKPGGRLVFSVFHPQMAAAGMQAQFMRDGVGYRLGANPFTLADYEKWIEEAGFKLTGLHEYEGDAKLVENMPFAGILVGFPVLVVMEAAKP